MSKLIPMDEAAAILGMTMEQMTELRSNNEIFGYRDGSNWKFKMSEIERVAEEKGIKIDSSRSDDEASDSFGFDLSDSFKMAGDDEDDDSVSLADSGILSSDDVLGSGELSFGSSSLSLASGSGKSGKDIEDGKSSDLLDDEPEKKGSPSDTGKLSEGANDDDLLLSEDDLFSDELSLADSASFEESAELSSDFEESPLILDDSDSSQEILLDSNDSSISLSDDSLALGGSEIDSLELSEEIISLDDSADHDASTGLLQEDDFNLTPLEASLEEDESSGSQVIALEDSEIYADDSAATILGDGSDFDAQPSMLDDVGFQSGQPSFVDPSLSPMAPTGSAELPEAPYTIGQVLSLGGVAFLLMLGGMIAYNLAQNMWMPNDQVIGSGVLNFFLRLVGMENT